ncbi:MAG: NAD(P)-dependent oxidoreductase [Actinobacteria bacterium]|nr:MAG: NAD(P)-dependent oxidoreductase [Actinomycetota bacterium]
MSTVAVIGLGRMGGRIAGRVLDAGHELIVWNRTMEKAQPLIELGATAAESPADAARRAEAVITMVADPQALQLVTEGPDGVAAGASAATTVIQMSTVSPAATSRLGSVLQPTDAGLLDSPVLGSLSEVESGTLKVFAGGPDELVERWTPLLSVLGSIIRVGPVGAGTAAKLVANSTLLGVLGVLGEALALGKQLDLSRDATFEVLAATPVAAQAERRRPAIESGEFPPRFALRLALKDANLILEAAGTELKVIEAVRDRLAEATEASWGERDYSALLAWLLQR